MSIFDDLNKINLGDMAKIGFDAVSKTVDDVSGRVSPISQREIDEFALLIAELNSFVINSDKSNYSEEFPDELKQPLKELKTSESVVSMMDKTFKSLTNSEITAAASAIFAAKIAGKKALKSALGGPVGTAMTAFAIIKQGNEYVQGQINLGNKLGQLYLESQKMSGDLKNDKRENVQTLLIAVDGYRKKLASEHHDLKKLDKNTSN